MFSFQRNISAPVNIAQLYVSQKFSNILVVCGSSSMRVSQKFCNILERFFLWHVYHLAEIVQAVEVSNCSCF